MKKIYLLIITLATTLNIDAQLFTTSQPQDCNMVSKASGEIYGVKGDIGITYDKNRQMKNVKCIVDGTEYSLSITTRGSNMTYSLAILPLMTANLNNSGATTSFSTMLSDAGTLTYSNDCLATIKYSNRNDNINKNFTFEWENGNVTKVHGSDGYEKLVEYTDIYNTTNIDWGTIYTMELLPLPVPVGKISKKLPKSITEDFGKGHTRKITIDYDMDNYERPVSITMTLDDTKDGMDTYHLALDYDAQFPLGIDHVYADNNDTPTYSLQGIKMQADKLLKAGIYVKNGRKFIVR